MKLFWLAAPVKTDTEGLTDEAVVVVEFEDAVVERPVLLALTVALPLGTPLTVTVPFELPLEMMLVVEAAKLPLEILLAT